MYSAPWFLYVRVMHVYTCAGCVYHSLSYYCETGSLTEPGVRLAASEAT